MLGHESGDLEGDRGLEDFGGGGNPREGVSKRGLETKLDRVGLHRGEFMNGSAEAFLNVTDAVAVLSSALWILTISNCFHPGFQFFVLHTPKYHWYIKVLNSQ